jgi:hypothetical protein
MWKPWELVTRSHEQAVRNARAATTELARRRVERDEVELYLVRKYADRAAAKGAERPA